MSKKPSVKEFASQLLEEHNNPAPQTAESPKDPWASMEARLDAALEKEKAKLAEEGKLAVGTEKISPEEMAARKAQVHNSRLDIDPDNPLGPWVDSLVDRTIHSGIQPVVEALRMKNYSRWDEMIQTYPDAAIAELKADPIPYIKAANQLTNSVGRSLTSGQFARLLVTLACMTVFRDKIFEGILGLEGK